MTCRRAAWLALAFAGCVASVHAAQVPAPAPVEARRPLLWKVSDADNAVYLLGSFHLLKDTDYPLPAEIERAYYGLRPKVKAAAHGGKQLILVHRTSAERVYKYGYGLRHAYRVSQLQFAALGKARGNQPADLRYPFVHSSAPSAPDSAGQVKTRNLAPSQTLAGPVRLH